MGVLTVVSKTESEIVVSWTALKNAPRCGGPSITILGLNFGAADLTATCGTTSAASCSTSAWTSFTSLRLGCGSWSGKAISLTVGGYVGTSADGQFSFESPVVSHSLVNIPESGGAKTTISGLNFAMDCVSGETSIVPTADGDVWCNNVVLYDTTNAQPTITLAACASLCTSYVNCGLFFWGVVTYNGVPNINRCALFATDTCTASTYADAHVSAIYYRPCGTYLTTAQVCASSSWSSVTAVVCNSFSSYAGASLYSAATVSGVVGTNSGFFSFNGTLCRAGSHG